MPLAKQVAISLVLALLTAVGASAQTTEEDVRAIRKTYDDCFYGSITGQLSIGPKTEMNTMAERAFLACATEEQAIARLFGANGISSGVAAAEILKIKLGLKNTARSIAANPEKYVK